MYGLPKDFNGSIFVKKEMIQVCFNANQMIVHFEEGLSVISMGSFGRASGKRDREIVHELPVTSSDIMELLGHVVMEALVEENGILRLRFDNEQILTFYNDKPNYESYHIQMGKRTIIV